MDFDRVVIFFGTFWCVGPNSASRFQKEISMLDPISVLNQIGDFVSNLSALIGNGYVTVPDASDARWIVRESNKILNEKKKLNSDFVHDAACILVGIESVLAPENFRRVSDYARVRFNLKVIANGYSDLVEKQEKSLHAA